MQNLSRKLICFALHAGYIYIMYIYRPILAQLTASLTRDVDRDFHSRSKFLIDLFSYTHFK